MLRLEPKLAGMGVFGCDSEKNVYRLFSNLLPTAIHLLSDLHMKEITFKINSKIYNSQIVKKMKFWPIFSKKDGQLH